MNGQDGALSNQNLYPTPNHSRFNRIGNIQSIAMGHWSLTGSNTRNIYTRSRIFRINKVHPTQKSILTQTCPRINIPLSMEKRTKRGRSRNVLSRKLMVRKSSHR